MTIPDVYDQFSQGEMRFWDAVEAVRIIDCCPFNEAKRVVSEWADGLDANQQDAEGQDWQ